MRIAIIEPFPAGGLLHYSTQLADALAERGEAVTLVLPREHELRERSAVARRLEVLPPDARPAPPRPTTAQLKLRRARTAVRLLRTWLRIAQEARSRDYDVVLIGGSFENTLAAAAGLLLTYVRGRAPLVHVCHNVRPLDRLSGEQLHVGSGPLVALLRRLYPRLDLVFVHGERSLREFEASWPPTRLSVIPHGDESLFAAEPPPPADEPRVLFFGAWSKMKGLPVLMEAFDELRARRPDVRLTIAGPPTPEQGESARVLAWASARAGAVETLPGYVPIEDVKPLFARARAVVLPYLTAYQSGVVHLAMTMARATVASDVGDLPEAVRDGVCGLMVPPRDPHALAAALERVLADPALAARLGAAGLAQVREGSSWTAVAERVSEHLRKLR